MVNEAAVVEIDRVRKKAERHSDFEDDYWNASETEEKMKVSHSIFTININKILGPGITTRERRHLKQ